MRRFTLFTLAVLGISISTFGQIKVNSSGRAFFGTGPSATSYGAINLTADGSTSGLSINGASGTRFTIFKLNDSGYITRGGSTTAGIRMYPNGNVVIGAVNNSTTSAALNLSSPNTSTLRANYTADGGGSSVVSIVYNTRAVPFDAYCSSDRLFCVEGTGVVWSKAGYLQSSDINKKEDITPLTSALEKISNLSPVSFHYKGVAEQVSADLEKVDTNSIVNDSSAYLTPLTLETKNKMKSELTRKRIGLIAQEVEEVVPEVVRTMDDGTKGIMYSDLVSLLIEGIKELKEVVDEKQNYIDELEGRLQSVEETLFTEKKQIEQATTNLFDESSTARLSQNNPNPFNQETEISYEIPANANGYIGIYNLNGTQLKKYPLYSSEGHITISASEFQPGIYIYSLIVDNKEVDSKRMVLTD